MSIWDEILSAMEECSALKTQISDVTSPEGLSTVLNNKFGGPGDYNVGLMLYSLLDVVDEGWRKLRIYLDDPNDTFCPGIYALQDKLRDVAGVMVVVDGEIDSEGSLWRALREGTAAIDVAKAAYNAAPNVVVDPDMLLELAMKNNPLGGGTLYKLGSITYNPSTGIYTATKGSALTASDSKLLAKDTLLQHLNIAYYCLAVCYDKALAVKMLLALQIEEIEKINKKIATNNDWLNKANKFYQDFYAKAAQASFTNTEVKPSDGLEDYVEDICGGSLDGPYWPGEYNSEGGKGANADWSNIDVREQGNLTKISNAQESIRMWGDELSTNAQILNTKLTQITQNYNSFLSIATQLAKSTGEYFKSIASNVR
jgi:hypothetical protein